MELTVIDNKGKKSTTVNFDEKLVEDRGHDSVLHEVIVAHLANQRSGTHSTKNRSAVSGGGVKPWKQKGTGRARSGSTRSPLWRKGGIIFGPTPRSYRQELPKKKRRLAFKMAVKALFTDERLQVVDPIIINEPKTKNVALVYKKWNTPTDSIFVVDQLEKNLIIASKNIKDVEVTHVESLNTYDCLRARKVFITPSALEKLSLRVASTIKR